ncbi:nLPA lipoprotein [Firmicutes bacterium CAG:882]|nr:nLPA lipoprotein [Firmicutes bacterium CAG:882]
MKKFGKRLAVLGIAVLAAALAAGCGKKESSSAGGEKKELTYAKGSGPYTILFEEHIIPILEKQGYTFKVSELSLQYADEAIADGDVDFSVEQHVAYMEAFNKSYNSNLVALTPIPTVPASIFSETHSSLDEISDGMKIAVPQDEGNMARAFVMLQDIGWIKLKEGTDYATASPEDVAENPYNLEFLDIATNIIATTLADYDYGIITGSIVYNAGIDPSTALFNENLTEKFWLQVVVKDADKDTQWAKDIVEAYQSKEFTDWLKANNESEYRNLWSIPEY